MWSKECLSGDILGVVTEGFRLTPAGPWGLCRERSVSEMFERHDGRLKGVAAAYPVAPCAP